MASCQEGRLTEAIELTRRVLADALHRLGWREEALASFDDASLPASSA